MDERVLIRRLKRGDQAAFKEVVETRQAMVYNTVLGILQNAEDAEDVAQEVFVQVYESVHTFKEESKFSTWLYRIALSKAMDHIRHKKRKKRFAFIQSLFGKNDEMINDPPDFFHPGIGLENKQSVAVVMKAVKLLPEKQQTAFVLNKIEGLGYRQIGEIMNMSTSAVDSLLQRAKANLRKNLEKYYDHHG